MTAGKIVCAVALLGTVGCQEESGRLDASSPEPPPSADGSAADAPLAGDGGPAADAAPAAALCGPQKAFPTFGRYCRGNADCVAVLHQSDCCGTFVALGISGGERARFDESEQACRASYSPCMCAPRQLTTDDGSVVRDLTEVVAACVAGECTTTKAGATPGAVCPATVPVQRTLCPAALPGCTWGTHPQPECRTRGSCGADGTWSIVPPPSYCGGLAAGCPATPPSTSSLACSEQGLTCVYADSSRCTCVPCNCPAVGPPGPPCVHCPEGQPLGMPLWSCQRAPVLNPPCPAVVPNDGTPCDLPPGTACPPAYCGSSFTVVCIGGRWRWTHDPSAPCPICASPDTPIATPAGERPLADLRPGDLVYSVDGGAIRAVTVARVGRTAVVHHHVVRVTTADGRRLEISAGHPTADGRRFGDLRAGGTLDGHRLESVEVVPYQHGETYDILPASETGTYFAAGMLIGSTLE